MKRLIVLASIAMCALHVGAGETTDAVRRAIEDTLPAKLQTFNCPESAEDTKNLFYCMGAFVDGRWLDVLAKRRADQSIEIVTKIAFPPTPESLAKVARAGVTGDFRSVQCPPDAGISHFEFECRAVLADGSRLSIHAARYFEGRIAMDPFQWQPDSPSPLIRTVRAAAPAGAIEAITCPFDLTGTFDCSVHYAGGRSNSYTIRHTGQRFEVIADLQRHQRMHHILGAVAIGVGLVVVIAAVSWLIALNISTVVARLPFVSEQTVDLPAAGAYVLHLELPAFTFIPFWRQLQYAMADGGGRDVPMYLDPFPSRTSFGSVRRSVRLFSVQSGGRYQLRTAGAPADHDMSQWGLIVSRSYIGRGVLCAALIVGGSLVMLAGFILVNS